MGVLCAAGYRRTAWKNGGGETAEIAVFPPGASMEAFDWRLSMAEVAADGPFSAFADIDRTLTLLEGAGLALDIAGRGGPLLRPDSPPFSFPGDAPAHAALAGGPVRDLNVMTRRGRFSHAVTRLALDGRRLLSIEAEIAFLFCCEGEAVAGTEMLHRFDTLQTGRGVLDIDGTGRFCLVVLQRPGAPV